MLAVRMDRLLEYLTGRGLIFGLLWAGLACLTLGLAALLLTRWGQSQPLRKCLVLSLLAHLLLAVYSSTVQIFVAVTAEPADDPGIQVQILAHDTAADRPCAPAPSGPRPLWETFASRTVPLPVQEPDRQTASLPEAHRTTTPEQSFPTELPIPVDRPKPEPVASLSPPKVAAQPMAPQSLSETLRTRQAPEPVEVPAPQRKETAPRPLPVEPSPGTPSSVAGLPTPERSALPGAPPGLFQIPLPSFPPSKATPGTDPTKTSTPPKELTDLYAQDASGADSAHLREPEKNLPWEGPAHSGQTTPGTNPQLSPIGIQTPGVLPPLSLPREHPLLSPSGPPAMGEIPKLYQARTAPNRDQWAAQHGASEETEKAVQAALAWLAANQEPDGRWDAARHGAGRELFVGGRNRQGSGSQAHTATTGLTLLAFFGRGYTHQQGQYQKTLAQGLDYLLRSQGADGNLGSQADFYAFMYCHGIATLALSEAYAMTQDNRLRDPLRQALTYTLAAQHPQQGGWRYKPRDLGDTSQLGWQLMALKSAELSGIRIPQSTKEGAWRFLRSVASGRWGGLAAYRTLESPSPAMTAEALLCRLFLGAPPDDPACQEAGQYLLGYLPGQSEPNLYYWYYGTLGMFQLGGRYWSTWNEALQKTLLPKQQNTGSLAGSWDPNTRWDNYGGRIYSTALATLCLEVYYRYLPLYSHAAESLSTSLPASPK